MYRGAIVMGDTERWSVISFYELECCYSSVEPKIQRLSPKISISGRNGCNSDTSIPRDLKWFGDHVFVDLISTHKLGLSTHKPLSARFEMVM